jgi:hypothetical protein
VGIPSRNSLLVLMRQWICWIGTFSLIVASAGAHEGGEEVGSLPLFESSAYLETQLCVAPLTQASDQDPNSKPNAPQPQSGQQASSQTDQKASQAAKTSNDRIFWTLPNFLTVEDADNVPPMTAKDKFKVMARGAFDPSAFVLTGVVAALDQASDTNPSYGQGFQGYAKRYGTAYGDNFVENFLANATFPALLHEDPRYYQLGHGGFWRRSAHAIGRVIITRTDSGDQQFNYSEFLGAFSAAAISDYTYHPDSDRGISKVVKVSITQIGWDTANFMLREFWPDLRKLAHHHGGPPAAGETSPSK